MLRAIFLSFLLLPWQLLTAVPSVHAQATRRVVVCGDSQAQGLVCMGDLRGQLSGAGMEYVGGEQVAGQKTSALVNSGSIQSTVSSENPQIVVFVQGGNDRNADRRSLETTLQNAVTQAKGGDDTRIVIWVTPTYSPTAWLENEHQQTAAIMSRVLPGLGVHVIDGESMTHDKPFRQERRVGSDGQPVFAHLTRAGYQQWACELASRVATEADLTPPAHGACPSAPHTAEVASDDWAVAPPDAAGAQTAAGTSCDQNGAGVLPVHLGVAIGSLTDVMGLGDYTNAFYRYLTGISLVVAIVMVVYGGFRYLVGATSGDIGRGKEIIRDALVGMVLVLSAYAILNTFNPATVNLQSTALTPIQCVNLPASAVANRCESDSQCGSGRHCVQVTSVWNPEATSEAGGATAAGAAGGAVLGGIPGALVGGLGGFLYGTFSHISTPVKQCTDGNSGSPCGEDSQCSGGICAQGFSVCVPPTGNPVGSPCNDNSNCQSNNCSGSEGARQCRGDVPILTQDALASNRFQIPDSYVCFVNEDCAASGGLCQGPSGLARKFCLRRNAEEAPLGAPCFVNDSGVPTPISCAGAGGATYSCLACPPEGVRNWEVLNLSSDPNHTRIGSCRPASDVGSACASSAH